MRSKLIYWLVYSGMWLFSALPFRVLYMLSDLNCLLMYRIGKYRRRVVRGNLLRSFPEKTDAERLQIERKFYRYLSDYMLEDLKLLHMSAEELCERIFHPISGTPMDELFTRYMYFVRAKMGIVSSTTEALKKFYEKNSYALLKDAKIRA